MSDLGRLLDPATIAIAGLSTDQTKHGGRVLGHLRRLGFGGEIYGVNPGLAGVEGVEMFERVSDLPTPPDVVVCAVPAAAVSSLAVDAMGTGALVVFAGGFGESDTDGRALERDLTDTTRDVGVRVLGPNSGGVIRPDRGLAASFLTCLERPATEIRSGPVGVVTQSGGTGSYLHNLAAARGSGLAVSVSTGNEIDIKLGEAIDGVAQLAEVKVVLALVETVRDGPVFIEAVRSSLSRGKPVVVCRIGTGSRGKTLMTTHTGAMAVPEKVLQGVLDSLGVVVAETPGEAYDVAEMMARTPTPIGDRVAIVTHSGGIAIHLADLAERQDLLLPEPGPDLRDRLAPLLDHGVANNPLDMGGIIGGPGRFAEVVDVVVTSGEYDLVLAVSTAHPPAHTEERVQAFLPAEGHEPPPALERGDSVSPPEGGSTGLAGEGGCLSPPEGGSTAEPGGGKSWGPEGGSTGPAGEGGGVSPPEGGSTAEPGGGKSWGPEGGSTAEPGGGKSWGPAGGSTAQPGGGKSWGPAGGSTAQPGGGKSWGSERGSTGVAEEGVPVLHLWMAGDQASHGLDLLREAGTATTEEPRAAIRALAGVARLARLTAPTGIEPITGPFAEWGLPLTVGEVVTTSAEAVVVAKRLGYPVVVKLSSPGLAHKTEVGGVALDLHGQTSVIEAFDRVVRLGRAAGLEIDGARIERFRPGLEMIVGALVDPMFGPMVSVGMGGVLTELLDDVVFAPAPIDEADARAMIDRIRGRELLGGYRGQPLADVGELARIVSLVSRGLVGSGLEEVEVNPLVWTGEEWVAVDWLVAPTT